MRILLLNQVFHPDVAATAQMAHDLARRLVAQGHEVQVIASRSIYGQKGATLPRREMVDGADVHRVGVSFFGKGSILARLVDFAVFYLLAMVKAMTIRRPDVVVAFTTPPLIALVGWLMRTVRGTRYVYWLMDVYPDVLVASGAARKGSVVHRLLECVSRLCLRKADRVVVLGRDMQELVWSKGVAAERVSFISVWADEKQITPVAAAVSPYRTEWGLGDAFVVMYSGNLGLAHDIDTIVAAMQKLRNRDDVRFVFVGAGKGMQRLRERVPAGELPGLRFEPYQPRERLGELLACADLHLISQSQAMRGLIVPSKLYGIMAAGRPAAFIGPDDAEVARVLGEVNCGGVIRVGDADALVRFIEQLADDDTQRDAMGQRARAALEAHFSLTICCDAWTRLIEDVAHTSR